MVIPMSEFLDGDGLGNSVGFDSDGWLGKGWGVGSGIGSDGDEAFLVAGIGDIGYDFA